ncbi:MAG: helicase, partial [Bacteroidetes bacterium]
LQEGDLLMATQNTLLAPIANGDLLRVQEIGPSETRAGLRFTRVKVSLAHRSEEETHELFMFAHLLDSSANNLDEASHQQLLIDFAKRMRTKNIKQKSPEFRMAMMEDPYLNALRAVYGYAITGHKAQGGEWDEVFVWQDHHITQWNPVTAYRWWYTVITRARKRVHLPDAPFVG